MNSGDLPPPPPHTVPFPNDEGDERAARELARPPFGSLSTYSSESCALFGCNILRERHHDYCCEGHENLSNLFSSKSTPFTVFDGFADNDERNKACASCVILNSKDQHTGVPTLSETSGVLTTVPWLNHMFQTTNLLTSRDWLFFAKRPNKYKAMDPVQKINWRVRKPKTITLYHHDFSLSSLGIRFHCQKPADNAPNGHKKWKLHVYEHKLTGLPLYCLSCKAKKPKPQSKDDVAPDRKGKGKMTLEKSPSSPRRFATSGSTSCQKGVGGDIISAGPSGQKATAAEPTLLPSNTELSFLQSQSGDKVADAEPRSNQTDSSTGQIHSQLTAATFPSGQKVTASEPNLLPSITELSFLKSHSGEKVADAEPSSNQTDFSTGQNHNPNHQVPLSLVAGHGVNMRGHAT